MSSLASPFFLKRILDDITFNPDPKLRSTGYIYALLSFAALLSKAESDVQHLWFSRRAATRVKMELMAAVYMKALQRKDFSGITKKDEETDKEKISGKPTGKSGADIGKIVQLMSAGQLPSWGFSARILTTTQCYLHSPRFQSDRHVDVRGVHALCCTD